MFCVRNIILYMQFGHVVTDLSVTSPFFWKCLLRFGAFPNKNGWVDGKFITRIDMLSKCSFSLQIFFVDETPVLLFSLQLRWSTQRCWNLFFGSHKSMASFHLLYKSLNISSVTFHYTLHMQLSDFLAKSFLSVHACSEMFNYWSSSEKEKGDRLGAGSHITLKSY